MRIKLEATPTGRRLVVQDDGRGFDVGAASAGAGLRSDEHAGACAGAAGGVRPAVGTGSGHDGGGDLVNDDPIRVVMADDHARMRARIREALEAGGCLVCGEAATAEEAVALAVEHRPDVALLDIHMPGNGIRAAREIARHLPGTAVVMLTAVGRGRRPVRLAARRRVGLSAQGHRPGPARRRAARRAGG